MANDTTVQPADDIAGDWNHPVVVAHPVPDDDKRAYTNYPPDRDSEMVLGGAAQNPNIPLGVAFDLAGCEYSSVRNALALNPATDPYLMEHLANDPSWFVRRATALNPQTPPHVLAGMLTAYNDKACSDNWKLRVEVAQNPALPPNLLTVLARDGRLQVRAAVATRPNLPLAAAMRLAGDKARPVRFQVAANPQSRPEALRSAYEGAISADPPDHAMCSAIASNPASDEQLLRDLAAYAHDAAIVPTDWLWHDVRYGLASNPSTPHDLIEAAVEATLNRLTPSTEAVDPSGSTVDAPPEESSPTPAMAP